MSACLTCGLHERQVIIKSLDKCIICLRVTSLKWNCCPIYLCEICAWKSKTHASYCRCPGQLIRQEKVFCSMSCKRIYLCQYCGQENGKNSMGNLLVRWCGKSCFLKWREEFQKLSAEEKAKFREKVKADYLQNRSRLRLWLERRLAETESSLLLRTMFISQTFPAVKKTLAGDFEDEKTMIYEEYLKEVREAELKLKKNTEAAEKNFQKELAKVDASLAGTEAEKTVLETEKAKLTSNLGVLSLDDYCDFPAIKVKDNGAQRKVKL